MAQWKRIIEHPRFESINWLYGENFPIEVRIVGAEWIEQHVQMEHSSDDHTDPNIEQRAANFMRSLIDQLEQEMAKLVDPQQQSMRYRLEDAIRRYNGNLINAYEMYRNIRDVILYERQILDNIVGVQTLAHVDQEATEIGANLQSLNNIVLAIKQTLAQLRHQLEQLATLEHYESAKSTGWYPTMSETDERRRRSVAEYTLKQRQLRDIIASNRTRLLTDLREVCRGITHVHNRLINDRLCRWKRSQALAGNGATLPPNELDELQVWFEKLAEMIWTTRTTIDALRKMNAEFQMDIEVGPFYKKITELLQFQIVNGFVVEQQPPQVIKTITKFATKVRMLTTNIGIQLGNPTVTVSIMSESQAKLQQVNNSRALDVSSGELLNNTGNLEMQQSGRQMSCTFRNIQLKKVTRTDRASAGSVKDAKLALLFKVTFQLADVQIDALVMSLPVVVIVHGSQEPQSWATIMWDNGFSEICRQPFQVPDLVSWSRMAEQLNNKFKSHTGRGLTNDNMLCLCEKALSRTVGRSVDQEELFISYMQFCKDPLTEFELPFWDWFYACMKLTREHLRKLWERALIVGFISKKRTLELLSNCAPGTFLVRFSDSEKTGGITIAYTEMSYNGVIVKMFEPFTYQDFPIRSLADRINDLPECVNLYPDIPKEKAFGGYCKPTELARNGYVKTGLKVVVVAIGQQTSTPSTSGFRSEPSSVAGSVLSIHNPSPDTTQQPVAMQTDTASDSTATAQPYIQPTISINDSQLQAQHYFQSNYPRELNTSQYFENLDDITPTITPDYLAETC